MNYAETQCKASNHPSCIGSVQKIFVELQKKYIRACRERGSDCTDRIRDVYLKANVEYWRSVAESREGTYYVGVGAGVISFVALVVVVVWACVSKKTTSSSKRRTQ